VVLAEASQQRLASAATECMRLEGVSPQRPICHRGSPGSLATTSETSRQPQYFDKLHLRSTLWIYSLTPLGVDMKEWSRTERIRGRCHSGNNPRIAGRA
jgi:hypothetical protein